MYVIASIGVLYQCWSYEMQSGRSSTQ